MTIKAIIFDMDDTLYYEKDYVYSGMLAVDMWIKLRFQVNGFYQIAIELFESGEKGFIFNKTMELLNISYDESLIRQMIKTYRTHQPNIQLLDDAKWVLNHLSNDVKLGLISDGYLNVQANKVQALRLKGRFHSIILSDRFGKENWKPSRVPYDHAIMDLKVAHNECIYIGDNVTKDFITARKLGWKTIHIERGNGVYFNLVAEQEYLAHYKIDNLKKLSLIPEIKHLFIEHYTTLYS